MKCNTELQNRMSKCCYTNDVGSIAKSNIMFLEKHTKQKFMLDKIIEK